MLFANVRALFPFHNFLTDCLVFFCEACSEYKIQPIKLPALSNNFSLFRIEN